jgi:hypothetical protein
VSDKFVFIRKFGFLNPKPTVVPERCVKPWKYTSKKKYMKKGLLILIISLIQNLNVFGQDSLNISQNWINLKQQIKNKTEITLDLTEELSKSKKIDKVELQNVIVSANNLKSICESTVLNKSVVNSIYEKNSQLNTYLVHSLVNLEYDSKLKKKEEVLSLTDQLQMVETKICIESNKYNQRCKDLKMEELIFQSKCENEPPKVEFK